MSSVLTQSLGGKIHQRHGQQISLGPLCHGHSLPRPSESTQDADTYCPFDSHSQQSGSRKGKYWVVLQNTMKAGWHAKKKNLPFYSVTIAKIALFTECISFPISRPTQDILQMYNIENVSESYSQVTGNLIIIILTIYMADSPLKGQYKNSN